MKIFSAEKLHWLRTHAPKTREEFLEVANFSGTIPSSFPRTVHLEVGAKCNLNCTFCSKPSRGAVGPEMGEELIKRVISECAREGTYRIDFHFFNEPLLHLAKLLPAIKHAKAVGIPLTVVTTNITPLTQPVMRSLIEAGLDTLHLSFEGANEQTFKETRGIQAAVIRDRIHEAISERWFQNRRTTNDRLLPWMAITMVRTTETDEECAAFKEYWSELVDDVDIRAMNGALGRTVLKLAQPLPVRAPCRFVGDRLAIAADGRVTACAIDIDCELALGDVHHDTLYDIWHSKKYREFWAKHQWGCWDELPKPCDNCDAWDLHGTWRDRR